MTPRALVTGANGFLGSRLIRFLVTRGERVKAFVRAGSNLSALCGLPEQQVELCMGDITSGHTVYRALAGCNRLYHIAAGYTPWHGGARPVVERAVLGTREVLEAAQRRNIEKIVVTSSAATLGSTAHADLMDEAHDFNLPGAEPALVAKHRAESVALEQARLGVPVVVVKPTVISGPGDWRPTPSGGVLLRYLNWPTSRRLRIPQTGGLNIVDVDDVAAGHHLAMVKGRVGERYILGGENLDLRDLVQGILPEATGLSPALSTVSPSMLEWTTRVLEASARLRGGTPPMASARMLRDQICRYMWVSSAKAERELGYTHRSALEALARGVRWYEEQGYISSLKSKLTTNGGPLISVKRGA
jgi:dihydroflavonol-4-reductase